MIRRLNCTSDPIARRLSEQRRDTDHRCGAVCARTGIGFLSADGVFLISGIILSKTIDAGGDP
jgi:hypothetical protein